jgi:hypothetical protein
MTTVQILLLASLFLIVLYIYLRLRSSVVDSVVFILLALIGAALVVFPDYTTVIANKIGIGRGVDMVIYFSILFLGFVCLKLYARIRRLEQTLTTIIRESAMLNARALEEEAE